MKDNIKVKAGRLLKIQFSNLIENSIKHLGCDKIRIEVLPDEDEGLIIFEDDGIGIPDDKKKKILERGFKEGQTGGSGLGMYMVKEDSR